MVARHWVGATSCFHQVVQMTDRANLGHRQGFYGEEACNDENDRGVDVVCEKCCFDPAHESVQNNADRK